MARDFNPDHVEITLGCADAGCNRIELSGETKADTEAKLKKRLLEELRKFGLRFNETPYLQVNLASAEHALLALRFQAANQNMTFAEASRQVRAAKRAE